MYLAVLGREPELSNAELEAVFGEICLITYLCLRVKVYQTSKDWAVRLNLRKD